MYFQHLEIIIIKNRKELNLTDADFASSASTELISYIGYSGEEVYTASYTFEYANFSSLTTLNLSGTVFAVNEMTTSGAVNTAHWTFYGDKLSALTSLSLPPDQSGQTWYYTFASIDYNNVSGAGTVHWSDYSSSGPTRLASWDASWFSSWTWTAS